MRGGGGAENTGLGGGGIGRDGDMEEPRPARRCPRNTSHPKQHPLRVTSVRPSQRVRSFRSVLLDRIHRIRFLGQASFSSGWRRETDPGRSHQGWRGCTLSLCGNPEAVRNQPPTAPTRAPGARKTDRRARPARAGHARVVSRRKKVAEPAVERKEGRAERVRTREGLPKRLHRSIPPRFASWRIRRSEAEHERGTDGDDAELRTPWRKEMCLVENLLGGRRYNPPEQLSKCGELDCT